MFRIIRRIMHWARDYTGRIWLGFLCSFLATWFIAAPTMVAAWALTRVVDHARGGQLHACLHGLVLGFRAARPRDYQGPFHLQV